MESGEGLDGMGATDGFCAGLGKPEVLDLACLNQLFHSAGDVFYRHVRIDAVLIEEVDRLDFEPLE